MEIVSALDFQEDLKPEDQFIMCRICVQPICEGVPHHLHEEMHEGLLLGYIYRAVTNIMLHDDGSIPGDICDSCFKKLIDCFKFIEECVKANKIFLSLRRQFALCNRATNNLKDLSCLHHEINIKDDEQKKEEQKERNFSQKTKEILGNTEQISYSNSEVFPECYEVPTSLSGNDQHSLSKFSKSPSVKIATQVETTKNIFNKSSSSTTSTYSSLPMRREFAQQNISQHCRLKQSVVVREISTFSESYKDIRGNTSTSNVINEEEEDMESAEADELFNQFEKEIAALKEQNLDNGKINRLDKEIDPQRKENETYEMINQLENEVKRDSKEIKDINIMDAINENIDGANKSGKEDNEEIKEKHNVLINASSNIEHNINDIISPAIEENAEKLKLDSENNSPSQVTPGLMDTPKTNEKSFNSYSDLLKQNTSPIIKDILQESHNMKSLSNKEGYLIIKRTDSKAKGVSHSDRRIKNRYSLENKEKGKLISNNIQGKTTSKNNAPSNKRSSLTRTRSDKNLNKGHDLEKAVLEESVKSKYNRGIIPQELNQNKTYGESSSKSDSNNSEVNDKTFCHCKKIYKLSESDKAETTSCSCKSATLINLEKSNLVIKNPQTKIEYGNHTPVVKKKDKIIIHSNISFSNKGSREDLAGINGKKDEEHAIPKNTAINEDNQECSINKNKYDNNKLIPASNLENSDQQFEAINTANSLNVIDKEIDKFYDELPHDITRINSLHCKSSSRIINMDEITLNLSSNSSNSNHLSSQNQSKQPESNTSLQNQIISVEEYGMKVSLNETVSINLENSQNKVPTCKSYHSKYRKFWKSELTRKNNAQSSKELDKIFTTLVSDNSMNNSDAQLNNTSQNASQNLITIDENSAPILEQVNAILQSQSTSQIRSQDLEEISSTTITQLPNNTLDTLLATEIEHKEGNTENDVKLEFVDEKEEILIDYDYDDNHGILSLTGNGNKTNFIKSYVDNLEPISKDREVLGTHDENCCMNVNHSQSLIHNYLPLSVENDKNNEVNSISEKPKNLIATGDFIPLIDITGEESCNEFSCLKTHNTHKSKGNNKKSMKKRKANTQSPRNEQIPLFIIDTEPQPIDLNEELGSVQEKKRKFKHKQTKHKVVTNYDQNRLHEQNLQQQNYLVPTKATAPDVTSSVSTNESILIEDNESVSDKSESDLSIKELNNKSEPYSCQCCDRKNKQTPARVVCKICSDTFFTVTALKRHLSLKHREPNCYKCAWCAKEFIQWLCFEQHVIREHRAANKCGSCKLFFRKKSQMKLHNKKFHK